MMDKRNDFLQFLKALHFAAEKHKQQKRKGQEACPYINHPIKVAKTLYEVGKVRNTAILISALLHDTIEDTTTAPIEIKEQFGQTVLDIVLEVTNDCQMSKQEMKQCQIEQAANKTPEAQQLKLADLICNIQDIISYSPPAHWSRHRRLEYLLWAEKVAQQLKGCNPALEKLFEAWLIKGKKILNKP